MVLAPRVLVVVQAGGQGSRMDVLTRERAKPMLRYAGTHRLVDFPLSAAVAAGVGDVWLSVQYRAGNLHGHVAGGRPWDLDRTRGGLRWLVPEEGGGPPAQEGFARGNADDLLQFVDAVRVADPEVLVVTALEDEPEHPTSTTIAAEVFAYRPTSVGEALETLRREAGEAGEAADAEGALGDYPDALLPLLVREGRTRAVALDGYWADAGTPASYLRAHRDLLAGRVDVFDHRDRASSSRPAPWSRTPCSSTTSWSPGAPR